METAVQTCYRHPDQPAGVICQRCDRPICPRCMIQASVGFHCPECAKTGAQKVYRGAAALQVRPILTQVLIALNVGVFALGVALYGGDYLGGATTPMHINFALINFAFSDGQFIGVAEGEWYRLITSGFLHYGVIHLALNMYALWILGGAVEQMGGRGRLAAAYFTAIVGGSLGALLITPDGLTAGASGGVFGLMGAILVAQRLQGVPFRDSPLITILAFNLLFTFGVPGISVGGHLGGLVGGAIAGWALFAPQLRRYGPYVGYVVCAGIAVACVVIAIATAGV